MNNKLFFLPPVIVHYCCYSFPLLKDVKMGTWGENIFNAMKRKLNFFFSDNMQSKHFFATKNNNNKDLFFGTVGIIMRKKAKVFDFVNTCLSSPKRKINYPWRRGWFLRLLAQHVNKYFDQTGFEVSQLHVCQFIKHCHPCRKKTYMHIISYHDAVYTGSADKLNMIRRFYIIHYLI